MPRTLTSTISDVRIWRVCTLSKTTAQKVRTIYCAAPSRDDAYAYAERWLEASGQGDGEQIDRHGACRARSVKSLPGNNSLFIGAFPVYEEVSA